MAESGIRTETDVNDAGEPVRVTGTALAGDKRGLDTTVLNTVSTDSAEENTRLSAVEEHLECQQATLNKIAELLEKQLEASGTTGVIRDGQGEGHRVKVTSRGQLVSAPLEYSSPTTVLMDVINVPFNIISPVNGKQFVVTELILYGDKGVGAADASVQLYEADSLVAVLVPGEEIISLEIVKQTTLTLTGLNTIVSEGKWLTGITNDNNIFVNIAGYFVDALRE